MPRKIARWSVALWLGLCMTLGHAQSEDVGSGFKRISAEDETRLHAILAEPVPTGVLNTTLLEHFRAKRNAAERLGDFSSRSALYRQWMEAMPQETTPKNELAVLLSAQGDFTEALRLRQELIDAVSSELAKEWYRCQLAYTEYRADRFEDAQKRVDTVRMNLVALQAKFVKPLDRHFYLRIEGQAIELQSLLHRKYGRWQAAIQSATEGVAKGREALKLLRTIPNTNDAGSQARVRVTVADLGGRIAKQIGAYYDARLYPEAEAALKDYVRLSQEEELPPLYLQGINQTAGRLRFDQHEFVQAEIYYRRAEAIYDKLAYPPLNQERADATLNTISALEGQHRWNEALQAFERMDALAQDDEALQKRVKFRFERGLAYLGSKRSLPQAALLFKELGDGNAKRYPANHFFVAQARGLQGVALWRMADADSRARALPLLQAAARDYMLVDNIDYETIGVRQDTRDLIFATYLEAVFQTPNENTMDAMAAADWVRGGMVQEALADAAVRSATSDPALSDLVRGDQDARHEIEALRKFLAGDEGGSKTPLPEVAAKMRERIDALDASRRSLQTAIKATFPDYDRLVRPPPPTLADVTAALAADEALLMLLPTQDAVYVWAVNRGGNNQSARVPLTRAQLLQLVQDTRKTLDFADMGSTIPTFNAAAASTLYEKLLRPVQAALAGKQHLIIAAGGALGQIPFGVLLTAPVKTVTADAPWLIRQAAITHVPSLSAWLAVKQLAKSRTAPDPLVAWGDPQFGAALARADSPTTSTRHVVLTRSATAVDLEKDEPRSALKYADIPALPETRDELLAIAAALSADPVGDLRLGAFATKASVLKSNGSGELRRKRVVAFATHGLMAGDLPHLTQPALALASTGNEDKDPLGALLTLDEVLNLKLNADWVVLSACNTAAADGRADEALSGLARGFFYAGSRSLLVTHWAVESESAKQLTTRTMAHYTANPTERKAESLRQAMLAVMADARFGHPAYWAPYALVGDGGR